MVPTPLDVPPHASIVENEATPSIGDATSMGADDDVGFVDGDGYPNEEASKVAIDASAFVVPPPHDVPPLASIVENKSIVLLVMLLLRMPTMMLDLMTATATRTRRHMKLPLTILILWSRFLLFSCRFLFVCK